MTKFNIEVVSDSICPWCYVGQRRLERAISLYKKVVPGASNDTFNITWLPYYLDSSLPNSGVERDTHLANKYGADKVEMINSRLRLMGSSEGINFSFKGKIGNTRDAHRLVQLAKTKSNELQNRVITELFKSHFEQDGDITSHSMLIEAGAKAGLDRAEIKGWLDEGKGGDEVDREAREALEKGVRGVPQFTINGQSRVNGAQDVDEFMAAFTEAKGLAAGADAQPTQGLSC